MAKEIKKLRAGVGVSKNHNESLGSLSRRFTQQVKRSNVLLEARKRQYRQRKVNRRARKQSALVRVERKKKYEKLRKWGKTK